MGSDIPEGMLFELVSSEEVQTAYEIETAAFPPEEAASLEALKTRQAVAPKLFLGAYTSASPRTLIGYANATLATSLTADSMHVHDPAGTAVCVHGLAVVEHHRRTGVASALLKEYIRRLRDDPAVGNIQAESILLICHEDLIPLYTRVGFTLQGKSPVVHGPTVWFEMRVDLSSSSNVETSDVQDAIPPNVLAALTTPSRSRPAARLLSSFPSMHSLVTATGENIFDLLCPRMGCGSVVLKAGVAKLQRGASVELEPPEHNPPAPLERLPSPPEQIDWWLVTPSPMAFENIAFSHAVPSNAAAASQIKFLACAECDLGALGWSHVGGREFWLAVSRVGYR
ncbi:Mss4-like protein [Gautieria morchelliformis]|nr:Mss4-like protein [Gautieria morchelliformis]